MMPKKLNYSSAKGIQALSAKATPPARTAIQPENNRQQGDYNCRAKGYEN